MLTWWWVMKSMAGVGALAVHPSGTVGTALDQPTQADAERVALQRCGQGCTVLVAFDGPRCGALAKGQTTITWASASGQAEARSLAVKECARQAIGCQPLEAVCNVQETRVGTWHLDVSAPPSPAPAPPPEEPERVPITPATIEACERAFTGSTNEQACLRSAAEFVVPPKPAIEACDDHFTGDDAALECLAVVAKVPFAMAATMEACDDHFTGDANAMRCMLTAQGLGEGAPALIEACDDSSTGDENALTCLELALPR